MDGAVGGYAQYMAGYAELGGFRSLVPSERRLFLPLILGHWALAIGY